MDIRKLKKDQAEELENFLISNSGGQDRELAHDYINCMFSDNYRKPTFLVAINEGKIIGAIAYSEELFTIQVWGISWVHVHPDYRSQGLGEKLLKGCLVHIWEEARRAVTVILATYPGKTGLYEKLGFREIGRDHEDGAIMIKILEDTP